MKELWHTVLIVFVLTTVIDLRGEDFSKYGPCADDMQKFCSNVEPGFGRRRKCLREHFYEVSPQCRQQQGLWQAILPALNQEPDSLPNPCKNDLQEYCSEAGAEKVHPLDCLGGQGLQLSQTCQRAFNALGITLPLAKRKSPCELGYSLENTIAPATFPNSRVNVSGEETRDACMSACSSLIEFLDPMVFDGQFAHHVCYFKNQPLLEGSRKGNRKQ